MGDHTAAAGVSFDLFGTLVEVTRPPDPAAAVARELEARGVPVPDDWGAAYTEPHVDSPDGAEVPLHAHVAAALESRGVDPGVPDRNGAPDRDGDGGEGHGNVVRRAVVAAFEPRVETRPGAVEAVAAAADRGPVGVLSNCSVPELASRALVRSDLDPGRFDAVVTSVGCGWRKPDHRAFEAVAGRLDVPLSTLVHVGDDPETDGGAADAGATAILTDDVPLADVPAHLEARGCRT